ncbi:PRKR-interacting protein 1 homolog [Planococcus citri]|uniref:PRKR-interacting protein 1 homolog n=1 Tax=Planococcus citri TaxID=170843 RepID=UPI0031F8976F
MSNSDSDSDDAPPRVLKNAYDLQRMKLEKLMKNPDKPVVIPDRPKEKKALFVPDFVRNVMGSSAGAGSGEFHVYRHLRRKEYARQKAISEMSEKERLDYEFQEKLKENQRKAEEKTAKKRQKRLKKKARRKEMLKKQKLQKPNQKQESSESESSDSDSEDDSKKDPEPDQSEKCQENSKCDDTATSKNDDEKKSNDDNSS